MVYYVEYAVRVWKNRLNQQEPVIDRCQIGKIRYRVYCYLLCHFKLVYDGLVEIILEYALTHVIIDKVPCTVKRKCIAFDPKHRHFTRDFLDDWNDRTFVLYSDIILGHLELSNSIHYGY